MILLERVAKAVFHTDGIARSNPSPARWAPHWITPQSRSRSAPKARARSKTCPSNKPAPPTCSTKSPTSTNPSTSCASNTPCNNKPTPPPTNKPKPSNKPWPPPKTCATRSPTSTTSSAPYATTSTGKPHCFDIPICAALRSVFDSLDGIDALTDQLSNVAASITKLDELQPKLLALIPPTSPPNKPTAT